MESCEYYEDFGDNISTKLYMRLKLSKPLAIKSSLSTGFRAPSLPQTYFNSLSNQFISTGNGQESIRVAHYNNESIVTRNFGVNTLGPETSSNLNVGMAYNPNTNLSLVVNAYNILIKNRIIISGRFNAATAQKFADILDPIGISQSQFFTNAIDTKTYGLEVI